MNKEEALDEITRIGYITLMFSLLFLFFSLILLNEMCLTLFNYCFGFSLGCFVSVTIFKDVYGYEPKVDK